MVLSILQTGEMCFLYSALVKNWHNHRARHLKAMVLRRMGRQQEAMRLIEESLEIDRFNFGCRFEAWLLSGDRDMPSGFRRLMRDEARNYEELAVDYAQAGDWEDALKVVNTA